MRSKDGKKKKRERKNFHGEDWINIVIVYYTNTRGKLHTGKWCRVKEAGNRLTPEDTRITPMYAWSFEGGEGIEEVWRFSLRKLPPNQP